MTRREVQVRPAGSSARRFASLPVRRFAVLLAALALHVVTPASAQSDPRLVEALRLAQEGGSDSARALVTGLLRVTPPTDSVYPQMLYTMGLVSRSVDEMRRQYTRVSVEYANSPWADDAIYRLSLLDYAAGNLAGATRQLERIRNDYPDSPIIATASEWAARALFDQKRRDEGCAWLATGIAQAGEDVELKNRLEYLNGRCTGPNPDTVAQAPAPDTARGGAAAPPPTPSTAPPLAPRTGFGVQVAAVNTQVAADRMVKDLTTAGFKAYVVQDGRLFKVRAGPYPDRAQATAAAERIRLKLHHSPFVVPEP